MGSSILGVGQSALTAAQAGLATTGHNIANVNTPGYSRQVVVQSAAPGQNVGVGYVGKGTEVTTITRVYNEFLHNQVLNAQTSKGAVDSYYAQIRQIDNILADQTSGVSSAMQDFFEGVQDVASNPNSSASRQAMLSSAEAMAARFKSVSGRINELREGVNTQIMTSLSAINGYAQQIADLNDAIEKSQGVSGQAQPANDLLDQRDQVISDLSKEIKVTIVKQGNSYNVFMGTGQALTVGTQVYKLRPANSPTDTSKLQVAYEANGNTNVLADSSLSGGRLGGLLEFRSNSLEPAVNSLGRVAIGLAMTFNAQHQLGQDQVGDLGGKFFNVGSPQVNPAGTNNTTAPIASITASITDPGKLTTSDYSLRYTGGNYIVTRLSDNKQLYSNAAFPAGSDVIEGVTLANTGTFTSGDEFLIKPTANGATQFSVALTDIAKIAAAAPVRTAATTTNTGTGKISAGTVNSFNNKVTITFDGAGTSFNVVDNTTGATLASNVAYTSGGNIEYNGWRVQITGAPASGVFEIDHTQTSRTSGAGTISAAVPIPPATSFAPDPYLSNGVQVVFDSATAYHLVGTTSNVTGASSITGGTFATAFPPAPGANTSIVVNSGTATIGTGGAGTYSATGAKTTIIGGTVVDMGGGARRVTGATMIVEGGSNAQSTSYSGLNIDIDAAGDITVAAPAGSSQIVSTFRGRPATGLAFTTNSSNKLSVNGWMAEISGAPAAGDTFTVGQNTGGVGDNRNGLLLGGVQTANLLGNTQNSAGTFQGATMSLQGGYTYMVSQVGNKTRELEVSSKAEDKLLASAVEAQQAESGVNLDEEAANLMRYQQAYQAAAKVMQTASELFKLLLDLGT